jgi:hypothetical protein
MMPLPASLRKANRKNGRDDRGEGELEALNDESQELIDDPIAILNEEAPE